MRQVQDRSKAEPTAAAAYPARADFEPIAIVGMAGRFPGASSIDALWQMLLAGDEAVQDLSPQQLLAAGVDPRELGASGYVSRGALLAGWDHFDPACFGLSPREAQVMDPQQRLLLQCAWHALEDAAWDPQRYTQLQALAAQGATTEAAERTTADTIGVYAGIGGSHYLIQQLLPRPDVFQSLGYKTIQFGNDPAFAATQIAYRLGLQGPALTLNCACSTSLVAVQLACQALQRDECSLALAGGSQISRQHGQGYRHQSGGILALDGHCRPFDAAATGTVSGSGVAMVALRRLRDAIDQGDRIIAVIQGLAVNNDGAEKVGFSAPSPQGQERVIRAALKQARVHPNQLGYHECHGTGTALGDPIEIQACAQAHRQQALSALSDASARAQPLALGALKANVGHLGAAAGVSGLIKAALALDREQIPPVANFQNENPSLQLARHRLQVPTHVQAWPQGESPRYASVSAFGMGGTNAHGVLSEAPRHDSGPSGRRWHLLALSARTAAAGQQLQQNILQHLRTADQRGLADAAFSLARGRRAQNWRGFALTRSDGRQLADLPWREVESQGLRIALIFPGQGAQFPGMARGLYQSEAAFGAALDYCLGRLARQDGVLAAALRELMLVDGRRLKASQWQDYAQRMEQTLFAQCALFCQAYASAQLWRSLGVEADALLGHSIGEYLAACWSGALPLDQALGLVVSRARLMATAPAGRMLAVACSHSQMTRLLEQNSALPEVEIGVISSPRSVVLSASEAALQAWEKHLQQLGLACQPLRTAHAFHSNAMATAAAALEQQWADLKLTWSTPDRPCLSNLHGTWLKPEEWSSSAYWRAHLRHPVRFAENIQCLLDAGYNCFIDAGPGQGLSRMLRGHWRLAPGQVLSSAAAPQQDNDGRWQNGDDELSLAQSLGLLWQRGYRRNDAQAWDLNKRYRGEARRACALPLYPFEEQAYRLTSPVVAAELAAAPYPQERLDALPGTGPNAGPNAGPDKPTATLNNPALATGRATDQPVQCYRRAWQERTIPTVNLARLPQHCLILGPEDASLDQLQRALQAHGRQVWRFLPGASFSAPRGNQAGYLRADSAADYQDLTLWLAEYLDLNENCSPKQDRPGCDHDKNNDQPTTAALVGLVCAWALAPVPAEDTCALGAAQLLQQGRELLALSQGLFQSPWPGDGAGPVAWPLLMLSRQGMSVAGENLNPARSALAAGLQVLAQEQQNLHCRWLDIDSVNARQSFVLMAYLAHLGALASAAIGGQNLADSGPGQGIAVRAGRCWQPSYQTLADTAEEWRPRPGLYLITGANGGIGFSIADWLSQQRPSQQRPTQQRAKGDGADCRLLLLSRNGLSDAQRAVLDERCNASGWQWQALQADLSSDAAWQQALTAQIQQYGPVRGLVHAAGVAGGALLVRQNERLLAQTQAAKWDGMLRLSALINFAQLDFALLCSSQNALKGGIGRLDYALANAALDGFAETLSAHYVKDIEHPMAGRPVVVSVNWPAWAQVGMAARSALAAGASEDAHSINPSQALNLLPQLLNSSEPRVLVSLAMLEQVFLNPEQLRQQTLKHLTSLAKPAQVVPELTAEKTEQSATVELGNTALALAPRPLHLAPAVAPEDLVEEQLCQLWTELLGVAPIGRLDDFFALGGNSLLMVQLGVRLRERHAVGLTPQQLFAALSIAQQAELVRSSTARLVSIEHSGVEHSTQADPLADPLALEASEPLSQIDASSGDQGEEHQPNGDQTRAANTPPTNVGHEALAEVDFASLDLDLEAGLEDILAALEGLSEREVDALLDEVNELGNQ